MDKKEQQIYPDELIVGYLTHELNEKEQAELENWLAQDDAHKSYLREMTEIWISSPSPSATKSNREEAYLRFKQRVDKKKNNKHQLLRWSRTAAAVLAGIVLLAAGTYVGQWSSDRRIVHAPQEIEVPMGSRSRIVLQDGTIAWLNAGSKLSYPSEAFGKQRLVRLEGEAYFEVKTDKKRPFIVQTSMVDVEVLGTRFSVKDYGEDDEIEVILAEGSVNFIDKNNLQASFIMQPSQQAIYNKTNKEISINEVPVSLANVWTTGAHFFNEFTFEQIARILEKAYDVVIIFRDESKKGLTFYSDFRSDDTLDDILDILSSSKKFRYTKNNDIIEIF